MRLAFAIPPILVLTAQISPGQDRTAPDPRPGTAAESRYAPVTAYDPARNAAADIDRAIVEARKTGKHIILDIGGDWCPWCHALDQLFLEHPGLVQLRERNFIMVPVYYSSENKNEQVLSRYSKVLGIPHYFVLDQTGALLHSQHMIELQNNGTYSPAKMKDFLTRWSPAIAAQIRPAEPARKLDAGDAQLLTGP